MDEYVIRTQYEADKAAQAAEDRRQNHRIEKLEGITDKLTDLIISVKTMASSMEAMQQEQKSQGERLERMESEPGQNWKRLRDTAITVVVTALLTWALSKGGF